MIELDEQQRAARAWFEALRDRICAAFEAIEREAESDARFDYLPWDRVNDDGSAGGGGVRGLMRGAVFEKVRRGARIPSVNGLPLVNLLGSTREAAPARPPPLVAIARDLS